MLRYIFAEDLGHFPKLEATMFRDRALQFYHRRGWDISLTDAGEERDQYDDLNPLYVIYECRDGSHGGSMRFLPTTGQNMVNDYFQDLTGFGAIEDAGIWECTRFCLGQNAPEGAAAALLLGGAEVGRWFGLDHAVGVFDAPMVRIYRRLGWGPTVLGSQGKGRARISLGLWQMQEATRQRLLLRAGFSSATSQNWLARSLGAPTILPMTG